MINMPKWPWFNALSKSSLAFLYISNCFGPNGLWGCVAVTCSSSLVTKWELRAKWESGKILRIFQMWSKAHTGLTERWERDFEPSSSLREIPWPFIYKAQSHPETWKWENEKISNCSDLLENWHGLCLICQYYVCKVGKLYLWSPACENILQVSSLKATRVALDLAKFLRKNSKSTDFNDQHAKMTLVQYSIKKLSCLFVYIQLFWPKWPVRLCSCAL